MRGDGVEAAEEDAVLRESDATPRPRWGSCAAGEGTREAGRGEKGAGSGAGQGRSVVTGRSVTAVVRRGKAPYKRQLVPLLGTHYHHASSGGWTAASH